ncbi:hypothetical protein [Bacillus kexueae]|uniref:hypothetical protein n=1 Tax=Aeribacillus kexueae TaxID=2078952 RepID=UPI001FAEDF30|nr:hypothetical protein [Bacillus kexueae]
MESPKKANFEKAKQNLDRKLNQYAKDIRNIGQDLNEFEIINTSIQYLLQKKTFYLENLNTGDEAAQTISLIQKLIGADHSLITSHMQTFNKMKREMNGKVRSLESNHEKVQSQLKKRDEMLNTKDQQLKHYKKNIELLDEKLRYHGNQIGNLQAQNHLLQEELKKKKTLIHEYEDRINELKSIIQQSEISLEEKLEYWKNNLRKSGYLIRILSKHVAMLERQMESVMGLLRGDEDNSSQKEWTQMDMHSGNVEKENNEKVERLTKIVEQVQKELTFYKDVIMELDQEVSSYQAEQEQIQLKLQQFYQEQENKKNEKEQELIAQIQQLEEALNQKEKAIQEYELRVQNQRKEQLQNHTAQNQQTNMSRPQHKHPFNTEHTNPSTSVINPFKRGR